MRAAREPPPSMGSVVLVLRRDDRYDSEGPGIDDEDFIADQDVFIVSILRDILYDPNRQLIEVHRSRNRFTDGDGELHVLEMLGLFTTQRLANSAMLFAG